MIQDPDCRGSGLTFPTPSGRIDATWGTFIRAVPRQEPKSRGATSENPFYVI